MLLLDTILEILLAHVPKLYAYSDKNYHYKSYYVYYQSSNGICIDYYHRTEDNQLHRGPVIAYEINTKNELSYVIELGDRRLIALTHDTNQIVHDILEGFRLSVTAYHKRFRLPPTTVKFINYD